MTDRNYIIIKGSTWLYDRLDALGYHMTHTQKHNIMRQIWTYDKTLDKRFIKEIAGDRR